LTIDQLKERSGSFTREDLALIRAAAHVYAVSHGCQEDAAAYTSWYVESNTSDENAGWNTLPDHSETFAAWMEL
jgi:hypothetical protein